ncbi:PTS system protein, component EIIc [Citrobacter freundii]|nr:PTS system protein, component EIIc [Citrobacter freundii]
MVGGSGATMGLVICYLRSRSAHLRSIGRLSVVPSIFNINEPVIFGTPIVMNPVFFIPFLLAPMVNAVLAWAAMKLDLIGRVISVVPWTAPAPVGAAWALGWDYRAAILVVLLALVSAVIYFPFFKVYEKQLLEQGKRRSTAYRRGKSAGCITGVRGATAPRLLQCAVTALLNIG